jgi:hypothetical protein
VIPRLPGGNPRSLNWRTIDAGAPALFVVFVLAASACTRAPVPNPVLAGWMDPIESGPSVQGPSTGFHLDPGMAYAVFGIPEGDTLVVREHAGASGTEIAQFAHDAQPIAATGMSSALGSSRWIEILTPSGQTGWVQSRHLTEFVPAEQACTDPRLRDLAAALAAAAESSGPQDIEALISPHHGLAVRLDGLGGEVLFGPQELNSLTTPGTVFDWQTRPQSGLGQAGDFRSDVLVPLVESLQQAEPACNAIPIGRSGIDPEWPGEYANLNYLAFYVPQQAEGSEFVWHTWVLGFEYVGGRPYLGVILRYQGEI